MYMYFFSLNKNTKQMYTAAVYNVVFGKLNKILPHMQRCTCIWGPKRGKYHMVLLHFASDRMTFPQLYSLYCYNRYKYRNA